MTVKLLKIRKGQKDFPLDKLKDLDKYTGLEIVGGSFEELPSRIENIDHLNTLIINCPELTVFPKFIFELENLVRLKVKNSKIDFIDNTHIYFLKLKTLDLNSNKITKLPNWIYSLTQLEELSAAGNSIEEVSDEISKMKSLKRINLDRNNLTSIPKSLAKNLNLNHLSLEQNNFSDEVKNELFLNYKIWFN